MPWVSDTQILEKKTLSNLSFGKMPLPLNSNMLRERKIMKMIFLASLIYENLPASEFYKKITAKNNCEKPPRVVFRYDCHMT